jgi:hypothetical protein
MKSKSKDDSAISVTINGTNPESSAVKCNAIWKRNCPKCTRELSYTQQSNWRAANRIGSLCRCCRVISDVTREKHRLEKLGKAGTPRTESVKQKLREWHKNNMTDEMRQRRDAWKHNMSADTKNKLRLRRTGQTASEMTREKLRIIRLEKVREMGGFPSFNKTACDFMDALAKKLGFQFRHAMNGGEVAICGYSVDGYAKDKNVIFEYDESRHENLTRKTKDMRREKRMRDKIGCEIIRYSERFGKLNQSYPTHSIPINL